MKDQDRERFALSMKGLAVNASLELDKDVLRLYFAAMKGYSIKQFEDGCIKVLRTWRQTKMPPLGVITGAIEGSSPQQLEDRALMVANKILENLNTYGSTQYPDIEKDPVAHYLMTHRWPYLRWAAEVLKSENKWWVKEFCEAYLAYGRSGSKFELIEAPEPVLKLAQKVVKDMSSSLGFHVKQFKEVER